MQKEHETITMGKYRSFFNDTVREKALEKALDIRKFEIDLYWKRATYFWAFIAASFAAYFVITGSKSEILDKDNTREVLLFLVNSLGLVFSTSWYLVNRGSKFWQNNWEKHVDFLEDQHMGPLYKIVISKKGNLKWYEEAKISVSKINQILSVYLVVIWVLMAIGTLYFVMIKEYFDITKYIYTHFSYFTTARISILTILMVLILFIIFLIKHGGTSKSEFEMEIKIRKNP